MKSSARERTKYGIVLLRVKHAISSIRPELGYRYGVALIRRYLFLSVGLLGQTLQSFKPISICLSFLQSWFLVSYLHQARH
jgi:hypothetical protein